MMADEHNLAIEPQAASIAASNRATGTKETKQRSQEEWVITPDVVKKLERTPHVVKKLERTPGNW